MTDTPNRIVPVYLALDSSDRAVAGKYNAAIAALRQRVSSDPLRAKLIRWTVLVSDGPRWPRSRWLTSDELQVSVNTTSGAGYGAAALFADMRATIETDVRLLRADGASVHRPLLFLVAAYAPTESWHEQFQALTEYDSSTGAGFRLHPFVIPIALTQAAFVALETAIAPSDRVGPYATTSVDAAFAQIDNVLQLLVSPTTDSAATLRPVDALFAPGVHHSHVEEIAEASEIDSRPPPGSETAYLQMRCSASGRLTWNEFHGNESSWQLVRSSVDDSVDAHSTSKELAGTFYTGPDYEGCGHCGNRGYMKCDCGRLSCWDGGETAMCHWCNRQSRISGNIESASAVD